MAFSQNLSPIKKCGHQRGPDYQAKQDERQAFVMAHIDKDDAWIASRMKNLGLYATTTNHADICETIRKFKLWYGNRHE